MKTKFKRGAMIKEGTVAQSREVPFRSREEYLDILVGEVPNADPEKVRVLFDEKREEVTAGRGMFALGGPAQLQRAAYIRASTELSEHPKKYQTV